MVQIFKKYLTAILVLSLFLISSYLIYKKLYVKELPPNIIIGTGKIDGDLTNINTKYVGRIKKIFVNEGDKIEKGQIIAIIESKEYEAQYKAIQFQIEAKKKMLESQNIELNIAKGILPEDTEKAKASLELRKSAIKELEKNIDTLEKVVEQDKKDYERYKNLLEKGLIPKEKFEKIELQLKKDINQLNALLDKKQQLIAEINISESNLKQSIQNLKKIDELEKSILALKDEINTLEAQKEQIEAILEEMKIISPLNGYVIDKIANEGEVLGAGMAVITAVNQDDLYLKMFVDTIENGKIKLGDKGVIFLDSNPDMPIPAVVVKISQKAEFTPKEVAVKEDRIQRVFAVHLKPVSPNPLLKLGIPAIGVISIDGKGLPKSLKDIPEI
ncbi:efflux RND transporter periplasmic adaptor subunit [Venenivibrio stagnispumantis]|uniref:HlyD family secretion protein n=1 Tax=Venenivibrio stagnispumantis TaxID=407998 RepID=A0AA45WL02_9AQUI|nr:HlyD family secretion protein [Venenivibrio stagnispumantis]MCW4573653.1 HlyD family secretion protein [Venenivibrio stagnispumantis]SMP09668.1 HlyD family secretion protein [Venenivibrio stagnispumantis]